MKKLIVFWISVIAILLSVLWLITQPSYEPAITALLGIGGLISTHWMNEPKKTNPSASPVNIVVEQEINSYRDISHALVNLRNQFFSLNRHHRPVFNSRTEMKNYWDKEAKDFILAYTTFRDVVDKAIPFCDQSVNNALQGLIGLTIDELIFRFLVGGEQPHPEHDERQMKEEFRNHIDSINAAIKGRIANLNT